jgi:hypothetical protein
MEHKMIDLEHIKKPYMQSSNQRGSLTLGFIYAVVLVLGIGTMIATLAVTLTLTEALQYVAFAGSRAYFASDITRDQQELAAEKKVTHLLSTLPFLSNALRNGWIKVTRRAARNYDDYRESIGASADRSMFVGYQLQFEVPMLKMRLPIASSVVEPPGGGSFRSTVSSFLMREPTMVECQKYSTTVYDALLRLNTDYQKATRSPGVRGFTAVNDNGC